MIKKQMYTVLLTMCALSVTLLSCEQEHLYPEVIKEKLDTDFGSSFELQIALPENYNQSNSYHVLFTLDAEWTMNECISILSKNSLHSDYIIVGLAYLGKNNRANDFTPTETVQGTGQAGKLKQLIEDRIFKGFLADKYPNVSINRENTIFVGHSLGGLFGTYLFLKRSETFGKYILISSSYMTDDQSIFGIEQEERSNASDQGAIIYLANGSLEEYGFLTTNQHFAEILTSHYPNIKVQVDNFRNSDHDGVRVKAIEKGLSYLKMN